MLIRPFQPEHDIPALLSLWEAALGTHWPLPADEPVETLKRLKLFDANVFNEHFIAEVDGEAVGFALAQLRPGAANSGGVLAMGVHPAHRRRGIGRALLDSACSRLRERGARRIQLGSGGQHYFWPGVPCNLPEAWEFFQAFGFKELERSYDLTRTIDDYATPDWVFERPQSKGITLRRAEPGEDEAVCAWLETHEPDWTPFYRRTFAEGRAADVILAFGPPPNDGAPEALDKAHSRPLVGLCLAEGQKPIWGHLLAPGQRVCAPGAVFVEEAAREQGIGLALMAFASQDLRERGYETAFLGWTWLVTWYWQLGYHMWREYVMVA